MKKGRMALIAGTFGIFQTVMPLIGWICVHTVVQYFTKFEKLIPWIALILLWYIGGKMLLEGIRGSGEEGERTKSLGMGALTVQGIATSIDALSVGFTIVEYNAHMAVIASLIIGVVTAVICAAGLIIGKLFGTKLSGKASVLGGVILILIGMEIFVKSRIG